MTPLAPAPSRPSPWISYALTTGLVGLSTVAGALLRPHVDRIDLVLLYLLAVVLAAARFGRGPASLAAGLSVLAFDFFFVPPTFAFQVTEKRYVLTFALMLAIGLLTSRLTLRMRREELRSSLLSSISHDLRTPLAAITGAATVLRDEGTALDADQRADLLAAICEEAARLERLVRNLLDLTRLESGALSVRREWIPLEEVVGSALERTDSELAGRPVRTDLPADLPLISADPLLLEQLFVNLLENAARHTPPGSPIEIRARARAAEVTIEVADRGPGIPPGDQTRIFEKFVRGSQAGGAGAGLGLAICLGVARAHGGTLAAANRADGGGAVFQVVLPRGGDPPPGPPDVDGPPSDVRSAPR
jgi:K+-sensing histidine kinase KdpD